MYLAKRNDFRNFFDEMFRDPFFSGEQTTSLMKTDIKEDEDGFVLDMELPGVKKEDVRAELKDGYLKISATRVSDSEEKDEKKHFIRKERYEGSCTRSFYVGKDVTEGDIRAEFKDGVLSLSVPKVKPAEPASKLITID